METAHTAVEKLREKGINVDYNDIGRLCRKYRITELAAFGSATLDGVGKNGELCFLVSFEEGSAVTLFDMIEAEREFEKLMGKKAEIVEKASVKNPVRKKMILAECEAVYAR